jgi:hypothetical protein
LIVTCDQWFERLPQGLSQGSDPETGDPAAPRERPVGSSIDAKGISSRVNQFRLAYARAREASVPKRHYVRSAARQIRRRRFR